MPLKQSMLKNSDPPYNNVNFPCPTRELTDFKIGGLKSGACEQPWEDHVDGNGEAMAHVSLCNLNVLDFCGISGIALSTA